jgi:tetratricopeptide (TPR) repeat protein
MSLRLALALSLSVGGAAAGCAAHVKEGAGATPAKPAVKAAAPTGKSIANEDEYAAERSEFDALAIDAPERAGRRATLQRYLIAEVDDAIARRHPEDGYDYFKQALTLYDPAELAQPIDDAALLAAASRVETAFRKRGAHEEVVTALAVELRMTSGGGDDKAAQARYREVIGWLRGGGATENELGGAVDGRGRVIEDLEKVAQWWPSPFVVDELTRLYFERHQAGGSDALGNRRRPSDLRALLQQGPRPSAAYDLARLYLRISAPDRAVAELRKLTPPYAPGDEQVRGLVEKYDSQKANPGDAIAIAMLLAQPGHEDVDVAERVCLDSAKRFPKAAEPHLCAGQLAQAREQLVVALRELEAARQLQPTNREIWQQIARLYERRLFQLATGNGSDENLNLAALQPRLAEVESFHAAAAKQFPGEPLHPSLAGALFEVARGYYNVGKVDKAMEYLERSVGVEPQSMSLELMAQIRLKKGEGKESIALFEKAIAVPKGDKGEDVYWRARLRRGLADAYDAVADTAAAETARKAALADWDTMSGLGLTPEGRAEAGVERARLYYQLGDRDSSLQSVEAAIDAMPDRATTYADVIAFLIPRGELDEALDAYHRALGRNEVTEYLKVYCSLWIVDLARRAHQPIDPLANSYLSSMDGNKWYDDLARWATGRETDQVLVSRVDTPGKRAESAFYRGLKAAGDGKLDEARKLWHETVDTEMMAFFEFEMAQMFLKTGDAPVRPILKSHPSAARPSVTKPAPPPEGSI